MIYHLNQTGAVALAALLDGGNATPVESAVAALCGGYATSARTAERDIARLLDPLVAHRLVIRS